MPSGGGRIVVLDWSGASLDAAICAPDGSVLDRETVAQPLRSVRQGEHEQHVIAVTARWREELGPQRIVAPGMIGSRNGWIEMPYVPAPTSAEQIAAAGRRVALSSGDEMLLLPGVSCRHAMPYPDVMRGEEVQIIGADLHGITRVVLPGGHTKWAETHKNTIMRFQTFVTGELIAAMRANGPSLRPAITPAARDWAAFENGLRAGRNSGEPRSGLLSRLFTARTGWLAGAVQDAALADYFAGLAISGELDEAQSGGWFSAGDCIGVVGESDETEAYTRALSIFGAIPVTAQPDAAVRGAARVAAAANI